ncbi:MAG: hypothetical protein ACW97O_12745, partial [Candidatus Thorarchaeota archaeon]
MIKKSFFDMWDNLIRIVILNLGFILSFAVIIYFPLLFRDIPVLFFIALGIGMAIMFVYSGVVSTLTSVIADYTKPEFKDFLPVLKATYKTSLWFALINLVLVILFQIAFRVYGG